ncbi:MAG TPA: hypothetical protein VNP94_02725, partial [Actinomycetota bacterium]|nr:hypothetical protein [Actinomycetota bacterium]
RRRLGRRPWVVVRAPFPTDAGPLYTVDAVATMFNLRRWTIYWRLCRHRAELDPPRYQLGADKRLRRLITQHDVEVLRRRCFPVRMRVGRFVREKVDP